MEVLSVFQSHILDQLRLKNSVDAAFTGITLDYQALLRQCRELQVRNAQLDKEAGELRLENAMLQESSELNNISAANSEEVIELCKRAKVLQEELTGLYKEKAKLVEDLMTGSKQLQIVRENNEQQSRALTEQANTIKELKLARKELMQQLDHMRAAQVEAASELEARMKDKEAAESEVATLEADNTELSRRLVEMKMTEIERINEVNRICDEMMRNAQSMERAAAAEASSRSRQVLGKLFGTPGSSSDARAGGAANPALMDQLKGLTMQGRGIESRVPRGEARTIMSHEGGCYALAFDRSGARMASAGADKVVRMWEPSSGTQVHMLHGMQDTVTDLGFTCDQGHLLAAGTDHMLRMWDLSSDRIRHTLTGHRDKVSSVACSPVEQLRAASGSTDRTIKLWDLSRGFGIGQLMHASRCHSVRYSHDGDMLISGHLNGSLCFWDKRTLKIAHEVAGLHTQQICSVAVGQHAVLTCGKDNVLKLVDTRTFQVRSELRSAGFAVGNIWCTAAISADERHAAAGSTDGSVHIWETEGGTVAKTLKAKGTQSILSCCWSPQGAPLVTSDRLGNVTFWEG